MNKLLYSLIVVLSVLPFSRIHAYPPPHLPEDTSDFGHYIQRTMNLLETSTAGKKNTVKVLVYGQSLSEQEWWLEIKNYLETKYPDADLIIENKAIGGFSSQILIKPTPMDILNFYPDLVIFHVYGSHIEYENVMKEIRQLTTAEVAVWTDPGETPCGGCWSDIMSFTHIPSFADDYDLELMQIRPEWDEYMDNNNLTHDSLTKDGTHLNDHGNYLLAELIKPYLVRKSKWEADTFGLTQTYEVGKDIDWQGDTLFLPFAGNRIDVIAEKTGIDPGDSAAVLVDDLYPSDIASCYNLNRPNESKGCWAWCVGNMVRVDHNVSWVEEHWTLTIDTINSNHDYFEFHVEGSVTGPDGSGNSNDNFISNSGRVIIDGGDVMDGGDWHIERAHNITGLNINKGYTIEWDTYLMGTDEYVPQQQSDTTIENNTLLAKGLANDYHMLKLVRNGAGEVPVKEIRQYRPYLNRAATVNSLSLDTNMLILNDSANSTAHFNISSDTEWFVTSDKSWLSVSLPNGTGNHTIDLTAEVNSAAKARHATITVLGYGVELKRVTVYQEASVPAYISVLRDSVLFAADTLLKDTFILSSNTMWKINEVSEWINVSPINGINSDTIQVSIDTNLFAFERPALLVISSDDTAITDSMIIWQDAAEPFILTSIDSLFFSGFPDGAQYFELTSNVSWSISSPDTWANVDISSGTGDASVAVTVDTNDQQTIRATSIVISADEVSDTIKIIQDSIPAGIDHSKEENIVVVYPNPTEGIISIVTGGIEIYAYELLNLQGQSLRYIKNNTAGDHLKYSFENIRPGMYILRLFAPNEIYLRKIIINK